MVRVLRLLLSVKDAISPWHCAFRLFYAMPWPGVQSPELIVIAFIKLLGQNFVLRYPRAYMERIRFRGEDGHAVFPSLSPHRVTR